MPNISKLTNNSLKVLLIDVNCKHSSTGKIVYDLHTNLIREGIGSVICYGRGPLVKEPNIHRISSSIEVLFHALMTRVSGVTGCYSFFSTNKLIKIIKNYKPDVVHIHELHAYFVNIAPVINFLKKNNIKTVWTFHCEFMYTGKCGHAYDCEKWKSECEKCPAVREYPASLYFDFTKKMFNNKKRLFKDFENLTIVSVSKWLAMRISDSFLKDKDIRVVHNGIDTEGVFYPRSYEHLKQKHNLLDKKIVLAIAPNILDERKGGRWVLELAKRFKQENIKFILIGIDSLNQGFDDNVIVIGKTSNQIELAEYYSMADITLLPSKKETFSLICAESLACGTPILGFDSGAPREIAPEGHGAFVAYGDINGLEQELRSFFAGKLKFKSRSEHVLFCQKHYSNKVMVEKYLTLYSAGANKI